MLWSSGSVRAELGTSTAAASTLLAWRCGLAAGVLGLALGLRGARPGARAWGRQAVLGVLCQCCHLGRVVTWVGLGVGGGAAPHRAVRVSALHYLTPPTTALWAFAMFGGAPGPGALPGAALRAVGVTLALLRPRAPAYANECCAR